MCANVANASEDCYGASGCGISSCSTNYYDLDGGYSNGCECLGLPNPVATAGNSCGTAISLGTLWDSSAAQTSRSGNAPFPGREIWYVFTAGDDTDTNGDEFHVDIRFTSNPGNAYVMDVYRGGCGGTQIASGEASITDWYTDFNKKASGCTVSNPCGEGNCSNVNQPGKNVCSNDSASFYVRVRLTGAPTCSTYTMQFSNGVY